MPTPRPDLAAAAERCREQQDQPLWPDDHVRVCDNRTYLPVPDGSEWGGVWRVVRVNARTVSIEQGERRGKATPALLKKTDEPLPEGPAAAIPNQVTMGTLLRITPDAAKRIRGAQLTPQTLLVCLVDKRDKINVAPLGGDPKGHYWRLPRTMFAEIVDPATVLNPEATR
jgi:hypothetical protein